MEHILDRLNKLENVEDILTGGFTVEELAQCAIDMETELRQLRKLLISDHPDTETLELPRRPKCAVPSSDAAAKARLRYAVRYFYDIQRLRIAANNRGVEKRHMKDPTKAIELSENDQIFFEQTGRNLRSLEHSALKEVNGLLEHFKISAWLLDQHGIGPTMAGVICSSFDIGRANTVSALWAVSGLSVVDGKAPRPKKLEKLKYNAWLRTKMVGVMGSNFLKLRSPWRKFYDNYKHRKECQIVSPCMGCGGAGKTARGTCENCAGNTKPAPWGMSKGHRHNASIRYMIKMFLAALYKEWRTIENLPVRVSYQEQYLGHKHVD
jgi:hypothetical protein